jgi:stage II sporulation protein D
MNRTASLLPLLWYVLTTSAVCQTNVRIGVLSLFHPKELILEQAGSQTLSVIAGPAHLVLNGEPGHRQLRIKAGEDSVLLRGITSSRCSVERRDGSPVRFRLTVPGKLRRTYEGKLIIEAHHGVLTAVVSMETERAVASIVAAEMPATAPIEALKAQAVVARSFLMGGKRHVDFDFCDTTHCQLLRSPDAVTDRIAQAVRATRGLVLGWRGRTIAAMYSSRCGGQTHSLSEVGMNPGDDYPYYSVECRWCREHPVRWETRITNATAIPKSSNESARIARARQWGWGALPGSVFTAKETPEGLSIEGHSIGHSLGMCQFGAVGLANEGADFRYILAHFFPNTTLTSLP